MRKVVNALPGARQGNGIPGNHQNEHKEDGNGHFAKAFNAALDAKRHDAHRYSQEHQVAKDGHPGAGDERAEGAFHQLRCHRGELQLTGLYQKIQRPAAHHGIVRDYPQGRKDHQEAEPPSRTAGNQLAYGGPAIGPAAAADDGFRQENGDGQQ